MYLRPLLPGRPGQDNIFDKVFRGRYADEIEAFDPTEITRDYRAEIERLVARQRELTGPANYYKGAYAEFMIHRHLTYHAWRNNARYQALVQNLPDGFRFMEYQSVWSYKGSPIHRRDMQVDILARAKSGTQAGIKPGSPPENWSLIGEVKNQEQDRFSSVAVETFLEKMKVVLELEKDLAAGPVLPFVFCRAGFTREAVELMREARRGLERGLSLGGGTGIGRLHWSMIGRGILFIVKSFPCTRAGVLWTGVGRTAREDRGEAGASGARRSQAGTWERERFTQPGSR